MRGVLCLIFRGGLARWSGSGSEAAEVGCVGGWVLEIGCWRVKIRSG